MRKLFVALGISAFSVFLTNCSTSKTASAPKAEPETEAPAKVAEIRQMYSDLQLAEGKTIMEASCAGCHKIKEPQTRTVTKLEKVLPSMFRKAKLTEEQSALVRAYMLANAIPS